jgi:hypothetical protein
MSEKETPMTTDTADREAFEIEQKAEIEALKTMMEKGDTITWPEARPFYVQRYNGWIKDGEPHDLIKMLDRLQAELELACDHHAPTLTEDIKKTVLDAAVEWQMAWVDKAQKPGVYVDATFALSKAVKALKAAEA